MSGDQFVLKVGHPPPAVAGGIVLYADWLPDTASIFPLMEGAIPTDSEHYGTYYASLAMDADLTNEGWISNGSALPQWIACQFIGPKPPMTAYGIRPSSTNFPGRAPKSWTLQGSNDGSTWVTLDTVTNYTFANSTDIIRFPVANPGSFTRYRLTVTANNGNTYTSIKVFQLFTSSSIAVLWIKSPDGTSRYRW